MNRIPASEHPDVICHCTFVDGWAYPDPNHPCPAAEPEQVWQLGPSPELVKHPADVLKVERGGITYPDAGVVWTGNVEVHWPPKPELLHEPYNQMCEDTEE